MLSAYAPCFLFGVFFWLMIFIWVHVTCTYMFILHLFVVFI
nr:MAG TPA: hypothetical protein [Caudoviricetes sp.]